MGFELANFEAAVQHFNHYAIGSTLITFRADSFMKRMHAIENKLYELSYCERLVLTIVSFICFTAFQLIMDYLMTKFDLFLNI